jgi:tRNA threonylcarbamoyladenosine biosynthesis protein TsaB
MLVLAIDTSGKYGSIALARVPETANPAADVEIIEVVPLAGGTFSAQLVPQIAALLAKHGFRKEDIGGFACASGPGSFTGLRVGLAAIKALAEVLGKPITAVSLLEVLANAGTARGKVTAVLDAGRGEVYAGEYEVRPKEATCLSERLLSLDELAESDGGQIVTPDPNVAEALRPRRIPVEVIARPRSDAIARLGWRKIVAGETVSPEELEANYIRRSDAEIFLKRGG